MGIKAEIPKSIKGYEILERLAAGGFGAVYRVKQSSAFGREVAMKVILPKYANQPEFIRRFEGEAELIARLEHPHIVPLYDYWRDPNGAYLIMRYLKGGSVKDTLEQEPYGLEAASQLLNQIALALEFAHRNNVVHRDIKPGNILLDEDGIAYVADFGIAKDLLKKDGQETAPESIVGSLDYISPEQARSEPVSGRTDIYSLGVTLYEMIMGEHPFKAFSTIEKLYKHINDPLPNITTLDDTLNDSISAVIHKATAKNPADRYADVLAFAQAFREAANLDATAPAFNLIEQLTLKEHEFLQHLKDGLSISEIATAMFITEAGVKFHRRNTYKKLGVKTRVQAIIKARELDLIYSDTTLDAPSFAPSADSSIYLPEPINPYKGLQAFQMSDAQDFFGRDKFVERLLQKMQEGHDYQRFLAIVGPSGSGKSSLVKAGLIPALLQGKLNGNHKWYPVDMLPNNHPIEQLEIALQRVANEQAENIYQHLHRDERGLTRIAELILPSDETELLIYIDQFEETFTLCQDEEERQHFLNLLYTAATAPRSRVRVIVTLRADYYDKPLHYHQFGEMLRNRIETILPLGAKELERAIVGPTERVGIHFETGLVAQIVSEMTYQAAALPLLQYALTELFNQRQERTLTHEAYQAMGGAVGALANRAEELYQELDTEGRDLCKQLFLRLVTLGEGAEDTRRRATFSELISIAHQNTSVGTSNGMSETRGRVNTKAELMEEIIDAFADYRLLTLDHDEQTRQPTVEVAHEAILREWERLREWLNDSRGDIREERILSQNADEWKSNQRNNGYLLREGQLKRFEEWREKTGMSLTPLETEFIEASIAQHEAEAIAKAEQLAREEFMKRREIELIRQRLVRTRALVAVFVLAAILSVGLSFFAFNQRNEAIKTQGELAEALDIAQRSSLAFAANSALQIGETDLALALAMESLSNNESDMLPETRTLIEDLADSEGPRADLSNIFAQYNCGWRNSEVSTIWLFFACDPPNVHFHTVDILTGEDIATAAISMSLCPVGFSPDEEYFLVSDICGYSMLAEIAHIEIWRVRDLVQTASFEIDNPILTLRWSADSSMIASIDILPENFALARDENIQIGNSVSLWDAKTGELIRRLQIDAPYYHDLNFSHDGSMGIVGGWSSFEDDKQYQLTIFDTETGATRYQFERPALNLPDDYPFGAGELSFSPDDRFIWLGGYPNYLIDLATGDNVTDIDVSEFRDPVLPNAGFDYVLTGTDYGFNYFDLHTGEERQYNNFSNIIPLGIDDTFVVNYQARADYHLWDTKGRTNLVATLKEDFPFPYASYSPNGQYLATINGYFGGDYTVSNIYDADTLELAYQLDTDLNLHYDLAWSPDSRYLATATNSDGIILWDGQTGTELRRFVTDEPFPMSQIEFTPDGSYLVTGTGRRSYPVEGQPYLIMWDVETGEVHKRIDLPSDADPNYGIHWLRMHPIRNQVIAIVNEDVFTGGSWDGIEPNQMGIYLVDLDTGLVEEIEKDFVPIYFELTPDGTKIVFSALTDNRIRIYDYETRKLLNEWQSDQGSIAGVAISPDSRYLLTTSGRLASEHIVNLWDIETGKFIRRYASDPQPPWYVAANFSPQGDRFVTTGTDGTTQVWDFDAQTAMDWIRENRFVREFSCTEREQYRIEPLCEDET